MPLSPLEALDKAISFCIYNCNAENYPPGGVIQRMSVEVREALSGLTSCDTLKHRVPRWHLPVQEPDPAKRMFYAADDRGRRERIMSRW